MLLELVDGEKSIVLAAVMLLHESISVIEILGGDDVDVSYLTGVRDTVVSIIKKIMQEAE